MAVPFPQHPRRFMDRKQQTILLILRQLMGTRTVAADVIRPFPCEQRRDALADADQCLGKLRIRCQQQRIEDGVIIGFQNIHAPCTMGHFIRESRQQDAFTGNIRIALERVDHLAVLSDQHTVGIPSHDLAGKRQLHQITQLAHAFKFQEQNAFQPVLPDIEQPPSAQMLAQEHTEHGRCSRILNGDIRQMNAGAVAGGADEDFRRSLAASQVQDQFVTGGLVDLVHPCPDQCGKLLPDCIEIGAVKCHSVPPYSEFSTSLRQCCGLLP